MKLILIAVLALSAVVSADPAILLRGGLVPPTLASAALVAPAAAPVVAPVAPLDAYASVAPVATVAQVSPLAQLLSDYGYGYSLSYNYQDYYPVANSALRLPYTLPYAYASDYYYRN